MGEKLIIQFTIKKHIHLFGYESHGCVARRESVVVCGRWADCPGSDFQGSGQRQTGPITGKADDQMLKCADQSSRETRRGRGERKETQWEL